MSWIVAELHITGFRGILDRAGDFELAQGRSPRSIALYASNSCGKSSYADAIEYLFSPAGRVARLGPGGREDGPALPHVLASERGIVPQVAMTLVNTESGEVIQVSRPIRPGSTDTLPSALRPILCQAPAHRVLRQHDLHRFVGDMTPAERYAELSRWLDLAHLEQVLGHLETASWLLQSLDLDRESEERVRDIARHTAGAVTGYDEQAILAWCAANVERHLGTRPPMASEQDLRKAIRTLKRLQGQLILASAAAEAYQAKRTLEQQATDLVAPDGLLRVFRTALADAVAAEEKTSHLLAAAKDSVFQEAWEVAQRVLESQITDQCPVCLTPWGRTRAGSQQGAVVTLRESRSKLARLATAQQEQQQATRAWETAIQELGASLARIPPAAGKLSLSEVETQAAELVQAVRTLSASGRFPSQMQGEWEVLLSRCHRFVVQVLQPALADLQVMEVPSTAAEVGATIEHLQVLQEALVRLAELDREREECRRVERSFNAVAEAIQTRASTLVNDIVADLQHDVQVIYQAIHPAAHNCRAAPDIAICPDTASKTLTLRVGFHSPDRSVPPASYLSESQVSTLGLALFLSAVSRFNRAFPFLVLDDVDAVYDAEHKARLVNLIVERLSECQVFLTTRDWHFYSMLRSRLHDRGWLFERLAGWDLEHGPRRQVNTS